MRFANSFRTTILASCIFAAIAPISIFGQGRTRNTSTPAAAAGPSTGKQTAKQALTIVTSSLPAGEATRDYEAGVEVKGGKAPYTFQITDENLSIDADGKITGTIGDAGKDEPVVNVTDSSEPALSAERKFTIAVAEKKLTASEIIAEAKDGLVTKSDFENALSSKAEQSELQKNSKAIVDTNLVLDELKTRLFYTEMATLVLVAIIAALILFFVLRRGRKADVVAAVLLGFVALSCISQPAHAATPKATCGDPKFNANFFPAGTTETFEVVCAGVKGSKVEIGHFDTATPPVFTADPAIAVTDVLASANGVKFKMTVGPAAALGYPDMKIDGKAVESSLEIVSNDTFEERDHAITSLLQARGGSGAGGDLSASLIHGLAQYCGVEEKKVVELLRSPKPGTSKQGVALFMDACQGKTIAAAAQASVTAVYNDPRYTAATDAIKALGDAVNAARDEARKAVFDPTGLNNRLTAAETDVRAVGATVDQLGPRLGKVEDRVTNVETGLDNTTALAKETAGSLIPILSNKVLKGQSESAACRVYLQLQKLGSVNGQPPKGCSTVTP